MTKTDFKLTSEQVQNAAIIHVSGWLDKQSEGHLFKAAEEAHANGAKNLVIDLADVDVLTSAGIAALQRIFRLFHPAREENKSTHVKLCNTPAQVYQVLAMVGFLQTVPTYETLKSALESFE